MLNLLTSFHSDGTNSNSNGSTPSSYDSTHDNIPTFTIYITEYTPAIIYDENGLYDFNSIYYVSPPDDMIVPSFNDTCFASNKLDLESICYYCLKCDITIVIGPRKDSLYEKFKNTVYLYDMDNNSLYYKKRHFVNFELTIKPKLKNFKNIESILLLAPWQNITDKEMKVVMSLF